MTRFEALVSAASTRLRAELYAGGAAREFLERWSALLAADAASLLAPATLASEKAAVSAYFD